MPSWLSHSPMLNAMTSLTKGQMWLWLPTQLVTQILCLSNPQQILVAESSPQAFSRNSSDEEVTFIEAGWREVLVKRSPEPDMSHTLDDIRWVLKGLKGMIWPSSISSRVPSSFDQDDSVSTPARAAAPRRVGALGSRRSVGAWPQALGSHRSELNMGSGAQVSPIWVCLKKGVLYIEYP